MSHKCKLALSCFMVLSIVATLCFGCAEKEEEEKETITIGLLTDFTGVAASGLRPYTWAVQDLAERINQEDPIPGVKLRIAAYDTKYDPSRDIPGYEWVREKGAKVILTPLSASGEILKSFAERDKIPLFSAGVSMPLIEPPGWVFCPRPPYSYNGKTLLKWISEQWPNYPTKPKIGTVGWSVSSGIERSKGPSEYCQAHPDKFEYVGAFLAPSGVMAWTGETEKLKDCDYVYSAMPAGLPLSTFIAEFRAKGYTAKMIGDMDEWAFKDMLEDKCGKEAIDGSWAANPQGWWTSPSPLIELAKDLLYEYHPQEAEAVMSAGHGYCGGVVYMSLFFGILREAVEEVGAENFDGQAFYDTAMNFKMTPEGFEEWTFADGTRFAMRHTQIWEYDAELVDLKALTGWLPIITE